MVQVSALPGSCSAPPNAPNSPFLMHGNDQALLRSSWKVLTTCTLTGSSTGVQHCSLLMCSTALCCLTRSLAVWFIQRRCRFVKASLIAVVQLAGT